MPKISILSVATVRAEVDSIICRMNIHGITTYATVYYIKVVVLGCPKPGVRGAHWLRVLHIRIWSGLAA